MGSVMARRTVRGGTGAGCRYENPTAVLVLNGVQLETGWVGEKSLHIARGRSHLLLKDRTFTNLYVFEAFQAITTCTEIAGEPISRECRSRTHKTMIS